jgi:phage tail tape-measure protein
VFDAGGTLLIGSDGKLLFGSGGTLLIGSGVTPVIGDWPPKGAAADTGASEETSFFVVSGDTPESCSARGDLAIYDGTGAEAAF